MPIGECRLGRAGADAPAFLTYGREQLRDRPAGDGIDEVWRDGGQRFQDEQAIAESRVRNLEARLVDDLLSGENQIEIERPGGPGVRAGPAAGGLECTQCREHVGGGQD